MMVNIKILGHVWTITERTETEDKRLEGVDGYCDWTTRTIVIEREIEGNLEEMEIYVRKVKRHEIIHAFLEECGLSECSHDTEMWARNEEMVDWMARLGPAIYEAWKSAGAV